MDLTLVVFITQTDFKGAKMRRVVVTGLGMIAPCGNSVDEAWDAILGGRSAVRGISLFDASQMPVRIAAEVRQFEPESLLGAKEARQSSRFVQFAAAAAAEAVEDSGLITGQNGDRWGCAIGVGIGGIDQMEEGAITLRDRGLRRLSPLFLPYVIPNMAAGYVAMRHGLRGPNLGTTTACASGAHAIGEAFMHIATGTADVMVAGGAEAAICPLCLGSFARMKALSTQNDTPQVASRPFDRDRDGFVMGEGSGVIVLEEHEHATRRGARIYAEMVGWGASGDAHHITTPPADGDGIARAMRGALEAARIPIDQVDYINAHGTSTAINDACESAAIERVFGSHTSSPAVSSTKGVTGHCLGAAGGIEAAVTVLTLQKSVIPPTANYATVDPECRLDYVVDGAREQPVRYALSNSCGFGGQNACLAFRRYNGAKS